jgi:hypothetical protein
MWNKAGTLLAPMLYVDKRGSEPARCGGQGIGFLEGGPIGWPDFAVDDPIGRPNKVFKRGEWRWREA